VSVRAVRELVSAAEQRTYAPGDLLTHQGDAADGLLILLEGAAHARLRDQDGEHRIGSFAAGDLVGEMALVTREARTADVIAESPVRALLVPIAAFDRLAARHLELAMVLTRLVADRLGHGTRDGFGGKRIENFRILRCLGRGGMSVVYLAEEETTREMVALKMMSYRLIYDPVALSRFQHEADLVQGLEHENIARLKRLFPAYHTYFLVMELCDGVDLQRLLRANGPLPEREVRAVLGQLALALDYVHERGVVHRDVKAANVMITRRGVLKLTDFGIAAPAVPLDDSTRAADHALLGTPACMAPEQLSGGTLDGRTDVYALGCLAYELLTGRHLFSATNLFELVQQKLTTKLPRAAEIAGGISDELHAFLERSLRVKPADRLASVAPLAAWAAPCEPPPEAMMREETSDTPITPPLGSETTRTQRSSP
jgi:serine/threonine protein kinase